MDKNLFKLAKQIRELAYTPYSNFKVGAALKSINGDIFQGCNIENASYGLTICAERTAIFQAYTKEGYSNKIIRFETIYIVTDTEILTPPCGACRQVLWELCGDIEVVLFNLKENFKSFKVSELLPEAFDNKFLQ